MADKLEQINDYLSAKNINRFEFPKTVKVTIRVFPNGAKDEIEISGIYKSYGETWSCGSGVTNLKYANEKHLDAILKQLL